MNDTNTLRSFTSAWDVPRPRRGRKGFLIAIAAIFSAHGLLVAYLYKSTFEAHYAPQVDEPPVTASIVHPEAPPPPPPPSQPAKRAVQPAHPRLAASPPIDVQRPEPLLLPPADKPLIADQPPQPDVQPDPSEAKTRLLTNPQFDRQPSADDLAQYYPERANRLGKTGTASIRCTVSSKGALVGCIVTGEDPAAFGFGDAALKLAKVFKLNPATADGVPVDGGVLSTRITFKLPD